MGFPFKNNISQLPHDKCMYVFFSFNKKLFNACGYVFKIKFLKISESVCERQRIKKISKIETTMNLLKFL